MKKNANRNAGRKAKDALRRRERRRKKAEARRNTITGPVCVGLPGPHETVEDWEREHGKSPEGQEYLALADLSGKDYQAFAARLCDGLRKGSAAALCVYGMERCHASKADTPEVRSMDAAFEESAVFAASRERYEQYRALCEQGTAIMRLGVDEATLAHIDGSPEDVRGRALGLTALAAACEREFPAAFYEFFEGAPYSFPLGQEKWLERGVQLGLLTCTGILSRELRRKALLPDSAEEERTFWEALYRQAKKGSWTCLYELLLHQQKRPGFRNLPLAADTEDLLDSYARQPGLLTRTDMLWIMYFGYGSSRNGRTAALAAMGDARVVAQEMPGLIRLRSLLALHDYHSGRQEEAIEELRRCVEEAEPGTQEKLVAIRKTILTF